MKPPTTTEVVIKPLIVRFASRLRDDREEIFRYDAGRQISQIWDGKEWVDTAIARRAFSSETRMTKVNQETTDDC